MPSRKPAPATPLRVVVFMQENKTTDFYFPTLAAWGADVHHTGELLTTPPNFDQPHDRNAWVHLQMGDYPGVDLAIDNDAVIPFYSWLAKTFTFSDHHFGAGTGSTPGHMMAVGGQMPTLENPSFGKPAPVWDLPTVFQHAERSGITWAAFPGSGGYPLRFYKELLTPTAAKNIHAAPASFVQMAAAGNLPQLVYAWSPSGSDEHPPEHSDPAYVTRGQALVWERVDAVVKAGQWNETVFILTWDDWGGYTDHVATPAIELVPDALHPQGFQVIGGSRIPLIIFGGPVRQAIDNGWHSHASIIKTIIDLFHLPPFGVPRVDAAPSLAGFVSIGLDRAAAAGVPHDVRAAAAAEPQAPPQAPCALERTARKFTPPARRERGKGDPRAERRRRPPQTA